MTLNELTPGLQQKLASTDCRLRPDQHYMEVGEFDKVSILHGASVLEPGLDAQDPLGPQRRLTQGFLNFIVHQRHDVEPLTSAKILLYPESNLFSHAPSMLDLSTWLQRLVAFLCVIRKLFTLSQINFAVRSPKEWIT